MGASNWRATFFFLTAVMCAIGGGNGRGILEVGLDYFVEKLESIFLPEDFKVSRNVNSDIIGDWWCVRGFLLQRDKSLGMCEVMAWRK